MSCCSECAICFDDIDINVNCITTECNHRFHSKCFLTNASRNGFDCPMCRTELVENMNEDDEDEDDEDEDDEDTVVQPLSGFRWLFQRAEGEPIDENDEDDFSDSDTLSDSSMTSSQYEEELTWKREDSRALTISEMTNMLQEQNVSMRDILAYFLRPHQNQLADCDEFNRDFMVKMEKIIDPLMNYGVDNH